MISAPTSRPWVIALACAGCVLVTAGVFIHHAQAAASNQDPAWWVWIAASVMSGLLAYLAIRGSGLATTGPALFGGILVAVLATVTLTLGLSAAFSG